MAAFIGFLPKDATPFRAANTTDITDTTAQTIIAAPSDTAQAYYITSVAYMNRTVAEEPFIRLQDTSDTPLRLDNAQLDAPNNDKFHSFWPPIKVATGKGINGVATSAVGDVEIVVNGFLGTP